MLPLIYHGPPACWYCQSPGPFVRTRSHDAGSEYECRHCGKRHIRKEGDPEVHAFFPDDVAAFGPTPLAAAYPVWRRLDLLLASWLKRGTNT